MNQPVPLISLISKPDWSTLLYCTGKSIVHSTPCLSPSQPSPIQPLPHDWQLHHQPHFMHACSSRVTEKVQRIPTGTTASLCRTAAIYCQEPAHFGCTFQEPQEGVYPMLPPQPSSTLSPAIWPTTADMRYLHAEIYWYFLQFTAIPCNLVPVDTIVLDECTYQCLPLICLTALPAEYDLMTSPQY